MKKIIFFSSLAFCLNGYSQKVANLADTVRTVDPANPAKEYWVIHNFKGGVAAQGNMLNGKRDGLWREYATGTTVLTKLIEYREGVLHGANITFTANGMISTDETYLDNKLNGPRTVMNSMGRLKSTEYYLNGLIDGIKKTYYDDGKVQEEGKWKNGKRDGITKWYLAGGMPSLQYTYVDGVLQGKVKEYDDKGKIKRTGQYEQNNEDGEWLDYQDSVAVKKIIYSKGKIVREIPVKK